MLSRVPKTTAVWCHGPFLPHWWVALVKRDMGDGTLHYRSTCSVFLCPEATAAAQRRFDSSTNLFSFHFSIVRFFRYSILSSIALVQTTISSQGIPRVKPMSFKRQTAIPTGYIWFQPPFAVYFGDSSRRVCGILGARMCYNPHGWSICGVADLFYLYLPFGAGIPH